jgi:hypothetical protein
MARLDPLPPGAVPEVAEIFETIRATGHYIPNSRNVTLLAFRHQREEDYH